MGTICITNPHEVHATICENKIGNSFFTFYISPDVLKKLNSMSLPFFDDKIIYDEVLFQQLYSISQNFDYPKFDVEKKLVKTLKRLVARYAKVSIFSDEETKLFQRFLEDDSFEKFSLENTAKKFGLDKYKFLRLFKQQTGLTPNNYIILKRIEKCKQLLQTQDDLLDIAIETGFYDATHYPELCKASLPFAAVIHSNIVQELKRKPIKKIPIYLFQGENDKVVSVLKTKKQVDKIGKMLKIKLFTYPNIVHNISPQMKMDYSKIITKMTTLK